MIDDVDFYLEDLKSKFRKLKNVGGYSKYYLSYSGGKDSHLLYWFIKEYAKPEFDEIEIVGDNTFMEHPQIFKRIRENSDVVLTPSLKPMEIKEKFGIPCFSKGQDQYIYYYQKAIRENRKPPKSYEDKINRTYRTNFNLSKKASAYVLSDNAHKITHLCCYYLKKKPFHDFEKQSGKKPILGVRGSESLLRKSQYKSCFTKTNKFTPLHDLTDEMEEKIYKKYNIEIPPIYDKVCRTGCMGCPYGIYKHDTEKELLLLNDAQFDFVVKLFGGSYKARGLDIEKIRNMRGANNDR